MTYQDIKQSLIDAGFEISSTGKKFFESGTYYLSHGEHSAPDYTIVKKDGEWVVRQERFFYGGTCNAESVRYGSIVDGAFEPRWF